jgi:hypothetical protein
MTTRFRCDGLPGKEESERALTLFVDSRAGQYLRSLPNLPVIAQDAAPGCDARRSIARNVIG